MAFIIQSSNAISQNIIHYFQRKLILNTTSSVMNSTYKNENITYKPMFLNYHCLSSTGGYFVKRKWNCKTRCAKLCAKYAQKDAQKRIFAHFSFCKCP